MFKIRLALAALCLISVQADGVERTWLGGTDNDGKLGANWSGGVVPGPNDIAILGTEQNQNIAFGGGATFNVGEFRVNNPNFSITNDQPGDFNINDAGITGPETLNFIHNAPRSLHFENSATSGKTIFTNTGTIRFNGNSNAGTSTFNISGAGAVRFVGATASAGQATFNTSGGTGNVSFEAAANAGNQATIVMNGGETRVFAPLVEIGSLSGPTGTVRTGGVDATASIGHLNKDETFGGIFLDNGPRVLSVNKEGTGTFTLTNTAHRYTGGTNINEGTLVFDGGFFGGFSSLFTVGDNGTLRGNGIITGSINNNGKLFPGSDLDPFGQLDVSMNYNSPAGTGEICFNITPTQANQFAVGGIATLTGSTGRIVRIAPGRYKNVKHPVIFTGGIVGNLGGPLDMPPLLSSAFRNEGNDVFLDINEGSIRDALTECFPNTHSTRQLSLARALEAIRGAATETFDINVVLGQLNVVEKDKLLNELDSLINNADFMTSVNTNTVFNAIRRLFMIMHARMQGLLATNNFTSIQRDNASSSVFNAKAVMLRNASLKRNCAYGDSSFTELALTLRDKLGVQQRDMGRNQIADNPGHGHLWFQGFGNKNDGERTRQTLDYRSNTAGVMMGFDYQASDDLRLGVAGGYSHRNLDIRTNLGHTSTETPFANLWGLYEYDDLDFEAGLLYERNKHHTKRNITLAALRRVAKSKSNGYNLVPHFAVAYNVWADCDTHIRPIVAFDLLYAHEDGFTETGANSLNLKIGSHSYTTLQSRIGFEVDRHIKWKTGTIRPSFEAHYINRSAMKRPKIVNSFAVFPQASFITSPEKENQHRLGLGGGLAYEWCHGGTFALQYNGDFGKRYKSHTGMISIGKSW